MAGKNKKEKKRIGIFKNLDYVLIAIAALLSVIGLFAIYSATRDSETATRQMIVQSAAICIGVIMMFIISLIDCEAYTKHIKKIYGASVAILIFVLIFGQGREETGSNSWIRIMGIGVQPSEVCKLAFAITFSASLSKAGDSLNRFPVLFRLFLHFAVLAGLVLLQNDTGTALVFAFMFFVMIFAAGLSYKYILAALGGFAVFAPVAWFALMKTYQKNRILVFLNPELDAAGSGYQVSQSKIAIGSGGFTGRGYLLGPQNQLGLLPEKDTDFIFGVIGEEMGFVGAVIVILLLLALIMRCLYVSSGARNDMGRYMCVGISAMFLFHVTENIFMCIGLMPVTGIPLPFLSYGGSSVATNFMAIGLVLSVWRRRRRVVYDIINTI